MRRPSDFYALSILEDMTMCQMQWCNTKSDHSFEDEQVVDAVDVQQRLDSVISTNAASTVSNNTAQVAPSNTTQVAPSSTASNDTEHPSSTDIANTESTGISIGISTAPALTNVSCFGQLHQNDWNACMERARQQLLDLSMNTVVLRGLPKAIDNDEKLKAYVLDLNIGALEHARLILGDSHFLRTLKAYRNARTNLETAYDLLFQRLRMLLSKTLPVKDASQVSSYAIEHVPYPKLTCQGKQRMLDRLEAEEQPTDQLLLPLIPMTREYHGPFFKINALRFHRQRLRMLQKHLQKMHAEAVKEHSVIMASHQEGAMPRDSESGTDGHTDGETAESQQQQKEDRNNQITPNKDHSITAEIQKSAPLHSTSNKIAQSSIPTNTNLTNSTESFTVHLPSNSIEPANSSTQPKPDSKGKRIHDKVFFEPMASFRGEYLLEHVPKKRANALVTFADSRSASLLKQVLLRERTNAFANDPAPVPFDIYWENFTIPYDFAESRKTVGEVFFLIIVLTWSVPVTIVSAMTEIDNLRNIKFLQPLLDHIASSKKLQEFYTGTNCTFWPWLH